MVPRSQTEPEHKDASATRLPLPWRAPKDIWYLLEAGLAWLGRCRDLPLEVALNFPKHRDFSEKNRDELKEK